MGTTRSFLTSVLTALAMFAFLLAVSYKAGVWRPFCPTPTALPVGVDVISAGPEIEVVAKDLDIPWDIAFLPDGDMLVTERPGTLRRIGKDGQTLPVPGVKHVGEGGLLGIVLHPDFPENGWLYLYMTTVTGDALTNRVVRYRYADGALYDPAVVIGGIPGAQYHDGGMVRFGPDGKLYVTTGDAGMSAKAQDTSSLAGKILRLNDDGSIPDDNPFGNAVWSYGHRNPQGLAWDAIDRLWATEHGRSGVQTGMDELNLIRPGGNYGWPTIEGDETADGMISPIVQSGADETWAPSGIATVDGAVYFAGLRGESLYRAELVDGGVRDLTVNLRGDFGRLRAVVPGPDGYLYLTTSNRDGRGAVRTGDDRIVRVDPKAFVPDEDAGP